MGGGWGGGAKDITTIMGSVVHRHSHTDTQTTNAHTHTHTHTESGTCTHMHTHVHLFSQSKGNSLHEGREYIYSLYICFLIKGVCTFKYIKVRIVRYLSC